jgi:hypothetical protein
MLLLLSLRKVRPGLGRRRSAEPAGILPVLQDPERARCRSVLLMWQEASTCGGRFGFCCRAASRWGPDTLSCVVRVRVPASLEGRWSAVSGAGTCPEFMCSLQYRKFIGAHRAKCATIPTRVARSGAPYDGDVAQLGEHHVRNVGAEGSNPFISTIALAKGPFEVPFLFQGDYCWRTLRWAVVPGAGKLFVITTWDPRT